MKLKTLIPLLTAAAMLLGAGVCEGISAVTTGNQLHQQAAERWEADGALRYQQLSVYYSKENAPSADSVDALRRSVDAELQKASLEAEQDTRLWYDAWSTEQGTATVRGTKVQDATAQVTAVGGDFFRIHPMTLRDGGYIQPDDLMHDRVVIDTLLAWLVFGSPDVAGMELTVNGTTYQIAGVVEPAKDTLTQEVYGEKPRIFMSFAEHDDEAEGFSSPSRQFDCYEAVLPNPVRGFAEKTLKAAIGEKDQQKLVVNTGRGSITRRWNNLRHLRTMVTASDGIAYPWWENLARMKDFSAAQLLRLEILLLLFPVLCLVGLIWKGYRLADRWITARREAAKRRYRTIEKDPYSV